jgi:hypothetical protein
VQGYKESVFIWKILVHRTDTDACSLGDTICVIAGAPPRLRSITAASSMASRSL